MYKILKQNKFRYERYYAKCLFIFSRMAIDASVIFYKNLQKIF